MVHVAGVEPTWALCPTGLRPVPEPYGPTRACQIRKRCSHRMSSSMIFEILDRFPEQFWIVSKESYPAVATPTQRPTFFSAVVIVVQDQFSSSPTDGTEPALLFYSLFPRFSPLPFGCVVWTPVPLVRVLISAHPPLPSLAEAERGIRATFGTSPYALVLIDTAESMFPLRPHVHPLQNKSRQKLPSGGSRTCSLFRSRSRLVAFRARGYWRTGCPRAWLGARRRTRPTTTEWPGWMMSASWRL